MKYFQSIVFTVIIFSIVSCARQKSSSDDEKADKAISNLQTVTQDFFQLKKQGFLVGLDKDATGGQASFFAADDSIRTQAWFVDIKENFNKCKTGYVANIEINNRKLFYLLCYDHGHPEIIGNYQEQNGRLVPIPTP